jgi:ribonuclease E
MPKRMLIDASHREETRVVVIDGQRVDEFDFEAASKRPLKGNIYLAKVTRVEPSLQAAFVEYGGNRQGFLAFSEIHPDYYQIPVADRQALLAEQQEEARRRSDDEFEAVATGIAPASDAELEAEEDDDETGSADRPDADDNASESEAEISETPAIETLAEEETEEGIVDQQAVAEAAIDEAERDESGSVAESAEGADFDEPLGSGEFVPEQADAEQDREQRESRPAQPLRTSRPPQRWVRRRHYKIQEVIKRKQIMLVQVVKEERGTKGAALTTYLSLAGRYCVLMPNTPRGGGISRKITNAVDRNRLKAAAATLELPEGMGLIIRTAGANRTKLEIKRDYEYLLRLWDQIRELTLQSNAPACVYEEGDIIKRAIRDLYNKDVSEIVVEGEEGYKNAKEFMRMLMPSHAKNVKLYRDPVPLFQKHHIEAQLDAMFQPTVTLKSGGYIVINQTEALVSIDVNSGRATREHSIEETAHKTNLEAADEIARQLRLRDLAGLIVIDFIDMEDSRNDRDVEKRVRDAVKHDRARVQIGKISQFGLLEMSRQRLRAGVVASSTVPCPHCGGQGIVRSIESTALRVLRALDEEGQRGRAAALNVRVANEVALYTLNQKRRELARIESDYAMTISFEPNAELVAGSFEMDRVAARTQPLPLAPPKPAISSDDGFELLTDMSERVEEEAVPEEEEMASGTVATPAQTNGNKKKRRRRRGRGGSRPVSPQISLHSTSATGTEPKAITEQQHHREHPQPQSADAAKATTENQAPAGSSTGSGHRRRRRRKPRSSAATIQPGRDAPTQQGANEPSRTIAGEHRQPEILPFGQPVTPNAPSEPVWSLGSDRTEAPATAVHETVGEMYYRREETRAEERLESGQDTSKENTVQTRPEQDRVREPVSESTAQGQSETQGAEQPQRRGWWQRPFKKT